MDMFAPVPISGSLTSISCGCGPGHRHDFATPTLPDEIIRQMTQAARHFTPSTPDNLSHTQQLIVRECDAIKNLLLEKNKKYGNSAANPTKVFAPVVGSLDQIAVRCDDKLSRIRNMGGLAAVLRDAKHLDEDTVADLIGYLVLARVVLAQQTEPVPR